MLKLIFLFSNIIILKAVPTVALAVDSFVYLYK